MAMDPKTHDEFQEELQNIYDQIEEIQLEYLEKDKLTHTKTNKSLEDAKILVDQAKMLASAVTIIEIK